MISVIIPTFNRAKFVVDAVRSVLDQKDVPEHLEIIVVDDGSTDNTSEALAALPGEFGCVRREHSGVSAARNLGISLSSGEWIAFLDSDDLWLPGKLRAQMKFFSDHPDALLCQTGEIWIRNRRRLNPRKYHEKPQGYCFPLLLERCLVSPSAVVIHRRLFDLAGLFDESLPACEDYDLWLRIGCCFPIGLVEKPFVIKRGGHPDQLSATIANLDKYRIEAIVKLLRTTPLDADQRIAAEKMLEKKRRIYSDGCRKRGNLFEAEQVDKLVREELARVPSSQASCQPVEQIGRKSDPDKQRRPEPAGENVVIPEQPGPGMSGDKTPEDKFKGNG
ncbi:MAG: glycosyltransferase [Syntrophobacteraceae bacterium]